MSPDGNGAGARRATPSARPAVSVVLPFAGNEAAAAKAVDALLAIERHAGDEIIVVDNSGTKSVHNPEGIRVLTADAERSAYYSRNVGADAASNSWLLFVDADCRPYPDILDRYFDEPLPDDIGACIGEVVGDPDQNALVARYARKRGHLTQYVHWASQFRPWGITANLLVRREAWESVGGFLEGIRSAGDTEFSWRLQDAGWALAYRPDAIVEHHHRDSLRRLSRQAARYGAGKAWILRRYPGSFSSRGFLHEMARSAAGVVVWTVTGRFERAAFKALDALYVISNKAAGLLSNTPPVERPSRTETRVAAIAGAFPALDDPSAVEQVTELGAGAPVEARARPVRVDRAAARSLPIAWAEDDGHLRRGAAVAWLTARHPLRVTRYALTGARGGRPRIRELATRARRVASLGVQELRPVDDDSSRDADALARLLGLSLRTN
jgi:GT2 family glycosyltransferase